MSLKTHEEAQQTFPADHLEELRPEFEQSIPQLAVEQFGYPADSPMFTMLLERNRDGRYCVEWVRSAWAGYRLAIEKNGGHK